MKMTFSKGKSILVITIVYLFAALVGCISFWAFLPDMHEMWALLLADVAATLVAWAFGLLFSNVSVYDPYWSVAPPLIFTCWAVYKQLFSLPVVLLLVAVWCWGVRLTGNWVYTFRGLAYEDWRYTRYRQLQSSALFQLTNFFGLNLMPTLVVFTAMLPGFGLFEGAAANLGLWLGCFICVAATTLQLVADTQMHRFRRSHSGQCCNVGLWRRGRHPNYFGEIMFWWGLWLMYVSQCGIDWRIVGTVVMTALFLFISIPMMERRQMQNKPAYAEYRKQTRILI